MNFAENPFLQPEDYMKGYRESVEKLKNDPNLVAFDRMCYELFTTDLGKRFMQYVTEIYLLPSLVNKDSPNFALMAIWQDGFKDAFRIIRQGIKSHDQRIKSEVNGQGMIR